MTTHNSLFGKKKFNEHQIEYICNDHHYYDPDAQLSSDGIHDQFKPKFSMILQPFECNSKICAKKPNAFLLKTNEKLQLNIIKEAEEVIENLIQQIEKQEIEIYKPNFSNLVYNDQASIKEKNQSYIFINYLEKNNVSFLSKKTPCAIQDKKKTIELFVANDDCKNERKNYKGLFISDHTTKDDLKREEKEEEKEAKQDYKLNQLSNQSKLNDIKLVIKEGIHKRNHKNDAEDSKFIPNDEDTLRENFKKNQIDGNSQTDESMFCKDYRLSQQIIPSLDCIQIIIPCNGTHLMVAKFCKKNIKVGLSKFQKVKRLHKKFNLR